MEHLEELWVPIEGYPNYEVSNYGRVVNSKRDRDMTPSKDKGGYYRVGLSHEGVTKNFYVHRLVAEAFFVNFDVTIEVKHVRPENRHDNSVLNLTLGTKLCRNAKIKK